VDSTPHEVLKGTAATKKTPAKIKRVQSARAREKAKATQRSGKWVTVRKKFLAKNKKAGCAACGNTVGLQVHHVRPYHLHPELELVESNLRAMCSSVTGLECHELLAHGGGWGFYVPVLDELCADLRADPSRLREIRVRAKLSRLRTDPDAPK